MHRLHRHRQCALYVSAAALVISSVAAGAQAPASPLPPRAPQVPTGPTPNRAVDPNLGLVTVEGCLVRGADAPKGPSPVARDGVTQDYILTKAKMIKGAAPTAHPSASPTGAPAGAANHPGTAPAQGATTRPDPSTTPGATVRPTEPSDPSSTLAGSGSRELPVESASLLTFGVSGITEAEVIPLLNQRVQIEGTFSTTAATGSAHERPAPLPNPLLRGVALRPAAGACK
jgi:hypothetical protein